MGWPSGNNNYEAIRHLDILGGGGFTIVQGRSPGESSGDSRGECQLFDMLPRL